MICFDEHCVLIDVPKYFVFTELHSTASGLYDLAQLMSWHCGPVSLTPRPNGSAVNSSCTLWQTVQLQAWCALARRTATSLHPRALRIASLRSCVTERIASLANEIRQRVESCSTVSLQHDDNLFISFFVFFFFPISVAFRYVASGCLYP